MNNESLQPPCSGMNSRGWPLSVKPLAAARSTSALARSSPVRRAYSKNSTCAASDDCDGRAKLSLDPSRYGTSSAPSSSTSGAWQAWSTDKVAQAQAAGQPVFVDFTAAWCVTCQFNKRTTFANTEVQAAFAQRQVLLLRADWTRRDAAISAELARLGRSGVPVYALYSPASPNPLLLSEILSPDEVRTALATLPTRP